MMIPEKLLEAARFCELECIYDLFDGGSITIECNNHDAEQVRDYFEKAFEARWDKDVNTYIDEWYKNPAVAKESLNTSSGLGKSKVSGNCVLVSINRLTVLDADDVDQFYIPDPLDEALMDTLEAFPGVSFSGYVYTDYSDYHGGEIFYIGYGDKAFPVVGETLAAILHADEYDSYEDIWECIEEEIYIDRDFVRELSECFELYKEYLTQDDFDQLEKLREEANELPEDTWQPPEGYMDALQAAMEGRLDEFNAQLKAQSQEDNDNK